MSSKKNEPITQEEQEKYFNDACENVRKHAFYMQQQLDQENLHDALRHGSTMINELRTSKLYPTRYYEVYMNVTSQLTHLENYILSEYRKKCNNDEIKANEWLKELYDRVQFCGNIVPRLYLLITVGSVCVKVNKKEQNEVIRILLDLVSLTKGVQHPTRGLFLRNYLGQITRPVLPDVPESVKAANIEDHPIVKKSVDMVLQNFSEMTRLWVRMQHQGAVRDRQRRERERLQLRMLVGTNLRRLSELNIISGKIYNDYVLKKVTEQIIKCKDKIGQEYLMECLIMVFSDEYHLLTLDEFLTTVNKLANNVNINTIIIKLMERLSKFSAASVENKQLFNKRDVFEIFAKYCKNIIDSKNKKDESKSKKKKDGSDGSAKKSKNLNKMEKRLEETLALQVELINFASKCYPGKDSYIDTVITESYKTIITYLEKKKFIPDNCIQHIQRMIISPLSSMYLRVLSLKNYLNLIQFITNMKDLKKTSLDLIEQLIILHTNKCLYKDKNKETYDLYLQNSKQIESLFTIIYPLIYDAENMPKNDNNNDKDKDKDKDNDDSDDEVKKDDAGSDEKSVAEIFKDKDSMEFEQFEYEQNLIGKLIHLIYNKNTDIHYKSLHLARKYFGKGGEYRLLYTFPPLVFNCLKLIQRTDKIINSKKKVISEDDEDKDENENENDEDINVTVKPKKMFQFIHQICTAYGQHDPYTGVNLWLKGGIAADSCGYSEICYEFFSQAYLCFEEHISDSNKQYELIRIITTHLQQIRNLDLENYDTLRSKTVTHSNRLLKKDCSANCLILCCNLYVDIKEYKDVKTALKCLNKACKRASQIMDELIMINIFINVLNKYIYIAINKNEIEIDKVNTLIGLIEDKLKENAKNSKQDEYLSLKQYFNLSKKYINDLCSSNDEEIANIFKQIK